MARYRPRRPVPRAYSPGYWVAVDLTRQAGPVIITIPEGQTLYVWRPGRPILPS